MIATARREEPDLFDADLEADVVAMIREAVECETTFAARRARRRASPAWACRTCGSTSSTSPTAAWNRWASRPIYGSRNPFAFMELQDVQELANFFERRVSAYQVGVTGDVVFGEEF